MFISFNLTLLNLIKIFADILTIWVLVTIFLETMRNKSFTAGGIMTVIFMLLNLAAINFNWN